MLTVGLTGGIGAGKSTVAARLADLGAVIVDADRLAREAVGPGTAGLAEVVSAFGEGILAADGTLDRAALGRRVFSDATALARLGAIMHPRIARLTEERMRAVAPDAIVVHDVPLLVENRLSAAYHLVLVVHAGEEERIRRLVADRGMSAEDAAARVAAQADDAARRAAADVWLDNAGDPAAVLAAVDRVWAERILPFAENLRQRRPARRPAGRPAAMGGPVPHGDAGCRVRDRVLRAAGELGLRVDDGGGVECPTSPDAGSGALELVLQVPNQAAVTAVRGGLEEAGFIRVPGGTASEQVHVGTDPGLPVVLRVRAADARWPTKAAGGSRIAGGE